VGDVWGQRCLRALLKRVPQLQILPPHKKRYAQGNLPPGPDLRLVSTLSQPVAPYRARRSAARCQRGVRHG